jgi:hypothetical protein
MLNDMWKNYSRGHKRQNKNVRVIRAALCYFYLHFHWTPLWKITEGENSIIHKIAKVKFF